MQPLEHNEYDPGGYGHYIEHTAVWAVPLSDDPPMPFDVLRDMVRAAELYKEGKKSSAMRLTWAIEDWPGQDHLVIRAHTVQFPTA